MSTHDIIMGAAGASGGATNYIEDVFSTYLYTGNSAARSISNSIDLSTNGGMVWIKSRPGTTDPHVITDTARGVTKYLSSNATTAQTTNAQTLTAFNTDGFSLGTDGRVNQGSTTNYASWTFRKKAKFFDVVTFVGDGVAGRTVAHNLGSVPGCMMVKAASGAGSWYVYHAGNSSPAQQYLNLESQSTIGTATSVWNDTAPTSSVFTVGTTPTNTSGVTYVAYLFANNAGGFGNTNTDNVITCGYYTTDASALATVNLGWEPQWILLKSATVGNSDWFIVDNMRGFYTSGGATSQALKPNNTSAEAGQSVVVTSTGFQDTGGIVASGRVIYIAIRRGPMKVPTDATTVFSPNVSAGTTGTAVTTNFPIDSQLEGQRANTDSQNWSFFDRLRGVSTTSTESIVRLTTSNTNAEATTGAQTNFWGSTGFKVPSYNGASSISSIYWNFRRAPNFFDEVCYTGTGANQTPSHNLGVAPQLIILKDRSTANAWYVEHSFTSTTWALSYLNYDYAASAGRSYDTVCPAQPTSSVFSLGTNSATNTSGRNYVAYLFASCPGVSKVGSYTGNGSSQTINCGFAAGARFILIKRTDSTGDWYVWDTARGIVAGNDGHISLNTVVAEVTTDDTIDPDSSGFIVNQLAATNVNVNAATYIYLAIA